MHMTKKEKFIAALEHQDCGYVPFDLGATKSTGISASLLYRLRKTYGRDEPVKIYDTFQMLGLVDARDAEAFGIDVLPLWSDMTVYGYRNQKWVPWVTPDGTPALIGEGCAIRQQGSRLYIYPQGDVSVPPSGAMALDNPLYFDYLTRQETVDEDALNGLEDYAEQLRIMTVDDATLEFYRAQADDYAANTDCGLVLNAEYANFGSASMLNGGYAKKTPGIRNFSDFLVAHYTNPEYVQEIYEAWTELAIRNLALIYQAVGDKAQAVFLSGTDFGTQKSEIMSRSMFRELYVPYYTRVNAWVHENTPWKTLYHSCGSLLNILPDLVECGLDCLNPVQTSSYGMDPHYLKEVYGKDLVFWGGAVDGQTTMSCGTPDDVERELVRNIEIFRQGGGFVCSVVHNLQTSYSDENVKRVLDVVSRFN